MNEDLMEMSFIIHPKELLKNYRIERFLKDLESFSNTSFAVRNYTNHKFWVEFDFDERTQLIRDVYHLIGLRSICIFIKKDPGELMARIIKEAAEKPEKLKKYSCYHVAVMTGERRIRPHGYEVKRPSERIGYRKEE